MYISFYSKCRNRYYVGSTSNLILRLEKHNTNDSGFTGKAGDWILKFHEAFLTKPDAFAREKQKCQIKKILVQKENL